MSTVGETAVTGMAVSHRAIHERGLRPDPPRQLIDADVARDLGTRPDAVAVRPGRPVRGATAPLSHRSAYMLVVVAQLLWPGLRLGIEVAAAVTHPAADRDE